MCLSSLKEEDLLDARTEKVALRADDSRIQTGKSLAANYPALP